MTIFNKNVIKLAQENTFFRKEIVTNENSQLVLMSIEPGDDIGEEIHEVDQILFIAEGSGESVLNGQRSPISANSLIIVPAGTKHNFLNTGKVPLKLFTLYSPPEEAEGTIHRNKEEALAAMNVGAQEKGAGLEGDVIH